MGKGDGGDDSDVSSHCGVVFVVMLVDIDVDVEC